jgi:hypothetical protein
MLRVPEIYEGEALRKQSVCVRACVCVRARINMNESNSLSSFMTTAVGVPYDTPWHRNCTVARHTTDWAVEGHDDDDGNDEDDK